MSTKSIKSLKPISLNNYIEAYLGKSMQIYNVLEWILEQTGKAHITIISFSISEEFIRKVYRLRNKDLIQDVKVDCDELKADISNKYSEVSKRYRKGQLNIIIDLHKQEIDLAKLGSPMAMENTRKFILSQKLSENV